MAFRAIVLCVAALMIASSNAGRVVRGSGSYSSSSSSASSSSGSIYFGDPGQAFSGSSSGGFATGGLGTFQTGPHTAFSSLNTGDLGTRGGFDNVGSTGNQGMKGVYTSSSSSVDSDGKIHYNVQSGRF